MPVLRIGIDMKELLNGVRVQYRRFVRPVRMVLTLERLLVFELT